MEIRTEWSRYACFGSSHIEKRYRLENTVFYSKNTQDAVKIFTKTRFYTSGVFMFKHGFICQITRYSSAEAVEPCGQLTNAVQKPDDSGLLG